MRALLLPFLLVLFTVVAPPARAGDCPKAAISTAASDLQDARNALMALPADKPAELGEMEMRVAHFVRAYMRCQPESADVEGIEVDLARLGWASAAADGAGTPSANPGWQLTFKAESFGQGQLGITATFSIPNGVDVVSMTFRYGDDGWAETERHSGAQPR